MKKHLNIKVFGKVQGVFFRQTTLEKAQQFGVTGFARNEPDGSVYIEAEGSPEAVEKLKLWCRQGPALAKVEELSATEGKIEGYSQFTVHR